MTSVMAGDHQSHVDVAVRVLRAALGTPPRQVGGVWLWRCRPGGGGTSCRWH